MKELSEQRFEALAGYTRRPDLVTLLQEAAWFATADERLIGVVTWDRIDRDYGWVLLGRDRRLRFRGIAVEASLASFAQARASLDTAMAAHAAEPDQSYHQGDEAGAPVDFFAPIVPEARLNPTFRILLEEPRYAPARELIQAMMRFYEDADGNFIEQFQTGGFDPRVWELYLFATFTELGFAREEGAAVPDLLLTGPSGRLAIEATTVNPPQQGSVPKPANLAEARAYIENYVPIKLARALTRKLYHKTRYWTVPGVEDIPFLIALQDFHAPQAMSRIIMPATEYVFGVRHSIVDGKRRIERLHKHVYRRSHEPSHFFGLPESENVSAVMLNPIGTIPKFNRMGFVAGFGDRRIKMTHSGIRRGEIDPDGPGPLPFSRDVHAPGYAEKWVEGMVILHNPNARIPLDPELIPGANHEFLQPDGSILSMLPEFQPYSSGTVIELD
ncbi:hypothetical protein [Sphingobium mellinum]|uniref:hypothetical protein n=1 Tax=Sphingobium mellinum TaxID=1387166 RepID=UPI0030EE12EC